MAASALRKQKQHAAQKKLTENKAARRGGEAARKACVAKLQCNNNGNGMKRLHLHYSHIISAAALRTVNITS